MSHLEAAKALVAEHAAATDEVLGLLNKLTTDGAAAAQAAVATATADLSQANDVLTEQINASLAQVKEQLALRAGTASAAPAAPGGAVL